MKRYYIFLILILGISDLGRGQEHLTLAEAVQIGIEHNYGIQIARNDEVIQSNLNSAGNAGMLPTAELSGNIGYRSQNTTQRFFSGEEAVGRNAGNSTYRAGIELNWTVFDGFRMFATKDRLEWQEKRSEIFTQNAILDLILDIQNQYYGLVRIQQQVQIIEQSTAYDKALLDLAKKKLNIGTGTRLDILQAETQLIQDSTQLIELQTQLRNNKIAFVATLGITRLDTFYVDSVFTLNTLPAEEILQDLAHQKNTELLLLNADEAIALARIKEERAALYPEINLSIGYDYGLTRNDVGFLLSNESYGPVLGIGMIYNLFPGRNINKDIANAQIARENIHLQRKDILNQLDAAVAARYAEYRGLLQQADVQKRNVAASRQYTALAQELYRTGRTTLFEARQAVISENQARDLLSNTQWRIKRVEIELQRLAGSDISLF